jgi:hypothetical protein
MMVVHSLRVEEMLFANFFAGAVISLLAHVPMTHQHCEHVPTI